VNQVQQTLSSWQDIDEGVYLAKQCYSDIWKPLLFMLFIVSGVMLIGISQLSVYWIIFIVWWLKPLYDRLILKILSLHVSQERLTFKPLLIFTLKLFVSFDVLKALTVRRFSFVRSFLLPIYQLEKNTGQKNRERIKVMCRGSSSRAANLTFMALLTENVITITFISMLFYLIPTEVRVALFDNEIVQDQTFIKFIMVYIYVATLLITEPLYVASGFSLYMNKRKRLEAWDIELVFKNLVKRTNYA